MARKALLDATTEFLEQVEGRLHSKTIDEAEKRLRMEIAREQMEHPWERVLVAVDHPDHAAVKAAITLAERTGASLGFLSVVEITTTAMYAEAYVTASDPLDPLREHAEDVLAQCKAMVPLDIPVECIVREGTIATEIAHAARDWHADILVIGSHRRGPIGRLLLGSTSAGVIPKTNCPMLLVTDETSLKVEKSLAVTGVESN